MQDAEWKRVARLAGYVYIPIGLFILFVFALIQYQSLKIERTKAEAVIPSVSTSTTEATVSTTENENI